MATKYDIQTITETHNRLADPDLSESEMQKKLQRVTKGMHNMNISNEVNHA